MEINTLMDLMPYSRYCSDGGLMTSNCRKIMYDIVDKFKNMQSLDSYDDYYTFYMYADEEIELGTDDDVDMLCFEKDYPNYETVSYEDGDLGYKVTEKILYSITVGKLNIQSTSDGVDPLHFIGIRAIFPEKLKPYVYANDCKITLSTKKSAYDNVYPDDEKEGWGEIFNIEKVLAQVLSYVEEILESEQSIEKYNTTMHDSLPYSERRFIIKRSDYESQAYKEDESKAKLEIVGKFVKDDSLESDEPTREVTPQTYIKVWNILHKGSHGLKENGFDPADDSDINKADEYFGRYNSKGWDLIDQLITKGEDGAKYTQLIRWTDCSILKDWIERQRPFHCQDVIYARTSLYCGNKSLRYSVSTHWHIDAFVNSLLYLYQLWGVTAVNLLGISQELFDTISDLYLNRDVIYFSNDYPDKYLRPTTYMIGDETFNSYCKESLMFIDDEQQKLIIEKGKELPWKYKLVLKSNCQ